MQKEFEQQLPAITNAIENARLQLNSNQFQFQKLCTVMDSKAAAVHSLKLEITDAHSKLGNVQAQIAVAETEFEDASSANEKLEQARETLRKRVVAAEMNRDKIAKICQNRMTAMSKRIVCFRCKYDAARAHPSVDAVNTATVIRFSREELIEASGRNLSANMVAQVQLEPSLQQIQTDAEMARRQVEEYLERWHWLLSPCVPKFELEYSEQEKSKTLRSQASRLVDHLKNSANSHATCAELEYQFKMRSGSDLTQLLQLCEALPTANGACSQCGRTRVLSQLVDELRASLQRLNARFGDKAAAEVLLPHTTMSSVAAWRALIVEHPRRLFCYAFALRCIHALLVSTYFNPDEFWQSLEVAHNMVFGTGFLTWEWQPHARIRSAAHPAIFAIYYWFLQLLGIDSAILVTQGPRVIQALFAAYCDVCITRLTLKMFGSIAAFWSLMLQWSCWFLGFCLVRTFSNSIEASLTAAALLYWPWAASLCHPQFVHSLPAHRSTALWLAAVACVFRPTSALPWALLGAHQLLTSSDRVKFVFMEVLPIGFISLSIATLIDYVFYGVLTFVPWNFVKFNSVYGVSELYGTHPFHWYLTEAFPVMMLTFAPLAVLGVRSSGHMKSLSPIWLVITSTLAYSFNVHKEYRFLLPMLPVALMYAGVQMSIWFSPQKLDTKSIDHDSGTLKTTGEPHLSEPKFRPTGRAAHSSLIVSSDNAAASTPRPNKLLWLIFAPHVLVFIYFALFHQRAPLSTIGFVRQHSSELLTAPSRHHLIRASAETAPLSWYRPQPDRPILGHLASSLNGVSLTAQLVFSSQNPELVPLDSPAPAVPSSLPASQFVSFVHTPTHRPLAVHFLMSCHSTPFLSHMHSVNVPLRQLDCSPKLIGKSFLKGPCISEATCFLSDPLSFLEAFYADPASYASLAAPSANFNFLPFNTSFQSVATKQALSGLVGTAPSQRHSTPEFLHREWLPTHMAMFNQHADAAAPWLLRHKYRQIAAFFHAPLGDELQIRVFTCIDA